MGPQSYHGQGTTVMGKHTCSKRYLNNDTAGKLQPCSDFIPVQSGS